MVRLIDKGFTLAELLISLAILGVIATFTIPKILTAQQNEQKRATAKEIASLVGAAYEQYRLSNPVTASTRINEITPYMNYVKTDAASTVDDNSGNAYVCGTGGKACLALHSGAFLMYNPTTSFSATNTTNMVYFWVDPDGQRNSAPSQFFYLTYPGRVVSSGDITVDHACSGETHTPGSRPNASWFSW